MTYANSADVYNRIGITTDDVAVAVMTDFLTTADQMVNKATGREWNSAAETATEYIDGFDFYKDDYNDSFLYRLSQTDRRYENVRLSRGNISTLTSLEFLNLDGTVSTTVAATDVVTNNAFFKAGLLKLESNSVPSGFGNIKAVYTYGVASDNPDLTLVKELAAYYAGIQSFVAVSGGTFDDVTSFTLGSKSVSLGEPYVNIREGISQAKERIKEILKLLGARVDMEIV
jgi:hypothetical protein